MSGSSFEVSVFVRNHWEIQSRFPQRGKADALENAKSMERARPGIPVKVVSESYDPSTGRSRETVIYKTPDHVIQAAKKAQAARRRSAGRGGRGGSNLFDQLPDPFGDEPAKPKGSMTLVGMVMMILLTSSGVAGAITMVFSFVGPKLVMAMGVTAVLNKQFLFAIFMLLFLVIAGILLGRYRSRLVLAKEPDTGKKTKKAYEDAVDRKQKKKEDAEAAKAADKKNGDDKKDGDGPSDDKKAAASSEDDDEPFKFVEEKDEEAEEELAPEPEPEPEFEGIRGDAENEKIAMMSFISEALKSIAERHTNLDNFARFGINLFIAGSAELTGSRANLTRNDIQDILCESVEVLGTKHEQAAKFAKSFESYLLNARYLEMVDAGRTAMSIFLDGDPQGAAHLANALDEWINPTEDPNKQSGPLAVMFTDIVGSTDMTVTMGDHAAQHIVRTHNRIVRTALTNYYGREIKHTGDGIMASFSDVANAVLAAVEIQKRVYGNNQASPEQTFNLCLGIEAGEPIAEDNDLFGVTVQMAARLCAAAETDQVLVSKEVYKAALSTGIVMDPHDDKKMKGFAEPIPTWLVRWDLAPGAASGAPANGATEGSEPPAAAPAAPAALPEIGD